MKRHFFVGSLLALALGTAGCSADSSPSATTSTTDARTTTEIPTPSMPRLESAVRSYSSAYLGGDGHGAWVLLSQRCQMNIAEIQYRAIVAAAKVAYGSAILKSVSVTTNGNQGYATYTYSDPSINQQDQPWVFESGEWHYDNC
jgi:PBP1b-binding outer membrane lipoprotein LpoB